ncbi:hypothetical protein FE257_010808 [Aspergillus nanangensis]|uniref:Uncharacterized protein n=1 Tax=Aspergillus nanangensis TaxID=2582783 RepID=A0AAD4CVV9_ASPNN|nr:hypothetical protein FE257_010808 [Aspergillus nanangensis]
MSHLLQYWLVFGPFDYALQDEAAYCTACIAQGPLSFSTKLTSVSDSEFCRLLVEFDEEDMSPNLLEDLTAVGMMILENHLDSLRNGGWGDPDTQFILPGNFYWPWISYWEDNSGPSLVK